jgi:hypothetical protein
VYVIEHLIWRIQLVIATILLISGTLKSQDLQDYFIDDEPITEYTFATFKTTRIINGQSIENPSFGDLKFVVGHHFGKINNGPYNFWGLDQSTIRLGLEYGATKRLALAVGRSSYEKTIDAFLKYKILRQSSGSINMPLSVSFFSGIYVNSLKWRFPERENYFSSRLSFVNQVLIARKFTNRLSFQITPTLVHKNLVERISDPNDIYAIGYGGRMSITNRITFNAEYYQVLTSKTAKNFSNMLSLGFDIETGGHVFQLHFTNAQPMFERAFITETSGKWLNGDIYFGFNIVRVFSIKKSNID